MNTSLRPSSLPTFIVTGASGFVGRHFLQEFKDRFYIYAVARRSQNAAHMDTHPNIEWNRVDIGNESSVGMLIDDIVNKGGADFIVHLAGYYDFENKQNEEFERTNVQGTVNLLKHADKLNLKRFIFASSTVVTEICDGHQVINEESPADADFPYAVSKRKCEELLKEYSKKFPCAIARFAAVYSDWCEYGPLYIFLKTWLSDKWNARILAGKGEAAVPYIHIKCLNNFFYRVIKKTAELARCPVLLASPDGCTSQKELYQLAARYNYIDPKPPVFIPKWFALFGVTIQNWLGDIIKKRPFEKPWMIRYVDVPMNIDSSKTREILNLRFRSRFHIKRRILFLIENKKTNPLDWERKNLESLTKKVRILPNLKIYEIMLSIEESAVEYIHSHLSNPANKELYPMHQYLGNERLNRWIRHIYTMLKLAVRTGNRIDLLNYAKNLASEKFLKNLQFSEVSHAIDFLGCYLVETMDNQKELEGLRQRVHDEIMMTIQLLIDELADMYEEVTGEFKENI